MIQAMPWLKANRDCFSTDYSKKLVSWVRLADLGPVDVKSSERLQPLSMSLAPVGVLDTSILQQWAEGKVPPTREADIRMKWACTVMNMVVSTALSKGSLSLRANKFFVTGGHNNLGISFCTMRAYFYSVKPAMGHVLLNLNACTSAFYKPILVSEFLGDTTTFKKDHERQALLRGLRVQLAYAPAHNGMRSAAEMIEARIKTITGCGQAVGQQTFTLAGRGGKPDEELTVQHHFARTYNINAQYPTMAAINCGTEESPKWYLPEKLRILPYQIYRRRVPDSLTADMHAVACHHPKVTRALIEHEGLPMLGLTPGVELAPFAGLPGIQIDTRMLQVPATTLPSPKPRYANGMVDLSRNPA
jgi:eukaryotic translation initiation factor 2C